jgi:hypothetical protein
MSQHILLCTFSLRRDDKIVPFKELLISETLPTEMGKAQGMGTLRIPPKEIWEDRYIIKKD